MSRTVCLIPARKGSKRLPGKNTADFHGRPLAAWTFDFARQCGMFDQVVLSTDDDEVMRLAPDDVVVRDRPGALAGDDATLLDVIRHVAVDCGLYDEDTLVLTPVTAPLRTKSDLEGTLALFQDHGKKRTAFTICANPHPPHLIWTADEDGGLRPVMDRETFGTRKQAFQRTFFWNDAFLMDTVSGFERQDRDLYGEDPLGVEVPPERSVPIDHAFDLWLAAQLFDPKFTYG